VAAEFDLDRALRRLKPEKHPGVLSRRPDTELSFVDDEELAGPPLLLDTCVYLHVLRGKIPDKVDGLLRTRTLHHSATAICELANRFGARIPANQREEAAREQLAKAIRDIPAHRIVFPTAAIWGEAGILAGLRARVGGFNPGQEQDGLNDALMFLQAQAIGATLLSANVADFDILQQLVPTGRVVFYREI